MIGALCFYVLSVLGSKLFKALNILDEDKEEEKGNFFVSLIKNTLGWDRKDYSLFDFISPMNYGFKIVPEPLVWYVVCHHDCNKLLKSYYSFFKTKIPIGYLKYKNKHFLFIKHVRHRHYQIISLNDLLGSFKFSDEDRDIFYRRLKNFGSDDNFQELMDKEDELYQLKIHILNIYREVEEENFIGPAVKKDGCWIQTSLDSRPQKTILIKDDVKKTLAFIFYIKEFMPV